MDEPSTGLDWVELFGSSPNLDGLINMQGSPVGSGDSALALQERYDDQRSVDLVSQSIPPTGTLTSTARPPGNKEKDSTANPVPQYKVVLEVAVNKREQRTFTAEGVEHELGYYWRTYLRPKFEAILLDLGLKGQTPSDTKAVVFAKGKNSKDFTWHESRLDIPWNEGYEKLVLWADPARPDRLKLYLKINFTTELPSSSSQKKGAKRRSRTQQALDERAECRRDPEVSSELDVYEKFRCPHLRFPPPDAHCSNKKGHCWLGPDGSHRILQSSHLLHLAARHIKTHGDVPPDLKQQFMLLHNGLSKQGARPTRRGVGPLNLAIQPAVISPHALDLPSSAGTPRQSCPSLSTAGSPRSSTYKRKNLLDESDRFFKRLKSRETLKAWEDGVGKFQEVAFENLLCVSQLPKLGADYFVGKGVKMGVVLRGLEEIEGSPAWSKQLEI